MTNGFGEFVKEKRKTEKQLTLRAFCKLLNEDPSNWSKIERGVLAPPQDPEKLHNIAEILGIEHGSGNWQELVDLASIDAGKIPEYIMNDVEIVQALPAFFRTLGSVKPSSSEIEELIETIKKGG